MLLGEANNSRVQRAHQPRRPASLIPEIRVYIERGFLSARAAAAAIILMEIEPHRDEGYLERARRLSVQEQGGREREKVSNVFSSLAFFLFLTFLSTYLPYTLRSRLLLFPPFFLSVFFFFFFFCRRSREEAANLPRHVSLVSFRGETTKLLVVVVFLSLSLHLLLILLFLYFFHGSLLRALFLVPQ